MSKYHYDENGKRHEWQGEWLQKLNKGGFYPLDILRKQGQFTLGKKHDFDEKQTKEALLEYLTDPTTRDWGESARRR